MKMQNLKPNLKEEKGTIWTFFLIFFVFMDLLIYLIFRGWSARENKKQKQKKWPFPIVIKESLQNCFIICILSQIKKPSEGHSKRDVSFWLLGLLLGAQYSQFFFSGNHTSLSWCILFKQFNSNVTCIYLINKYPN